MVITKDERVLKRWDYATVKSKKNKMTYTLTVTNKRVVYEEKNATERERREIPIKAVKSVGIFKQRSSNEKALRTGARVFLILACISTVIAITLLVGCLIKKIPISENAELTVFLVAALMYVLVGVIFNFLANKSKLKVNFSLVLTTYGQEGESMRVGMIASLRRLFKNAMEGMVKIKVSDTVTEEIIETIGALIVDNR